jgi:photosystem II stability/assembly factor-like uncharacterized protein
VEAGPAFSDPRHGWLFAGGKLYMTADGGSHWSDFATDVSLAGSEFHFIDPLHGWAFARDSEQPFLFRTEDGGRTWTALSTTIAQ